MIGCWGGGEKFFINCPRVNAVATGEADCALVITYRTVSNTCGIKIIVWFIKRLEDSSRLIAVGT